MTAFERQCLAGLRLASRVLGTTTFTLGDRAGTFSGVFSDLTRERDWMEEGGRKVTLTSTLLVSRDQLTDEPALGCRCTFIHDGKRRDMRVSRVQSDAISYTLGLSQLQS